MKPWSSHRSHLFPLCFPVSTICRNNCSVILLLDLVKVDWNSKMEVHVLMDLPMDLDDVDLGI